MAASNPIPMMEKILDYALSQGATQADIKMAQTKSVSFATRMAKPESVERSESHAVTVRLLKGKKKQSITSTQLDDALLKRMIDDALETIDHLPEDPYAGLADESQILKDIPTLDICDPKDPSEDILMEMVKQCEESALSHADITNSKGGHIGWDRFNMFMVSSNGFKGSYTSTDGGFYVQPVAGKGDNMQVSYDQTNAIYFDDLKTPQDVGNKAAEKTIAKLNPKKVKTGSYPVLFDNEISSSLIGHLINAISGPNIAKGVSFLKDKLGEKLFDFPIHIHDDPQKPRGLGSRPFDGEGFALKPMDIIKDGVLQTWLMDLVSARKLNQLDHPHLRGKASTTNITLAPGPKSRDEMIAQMGTGFIVNSLMSRPDSLANGDYSVGASGFWVENGAIAYPVHEVTLSGNLIEMFKGMEPASDITEDKKTNAPSLLIQSMTVGGE